MAILRLTKKNLRFLKSLLMSDFEMKSGHSDEVIAALCGFNTSASMRSAIKTQTIRSAIDVTFEEFERRCSDLGYDQNSSEYLKLIFCNLAWPNSPWVSHGSWDKISSDVWYYNCESSEFPFIRIEVRQNHHKLEWDCNRLPGDTDQHTQSEVGDDLVHQMHSAFQLVCRGVDQKSLFDGSAFGGKITGLSEASARQLANQFVTLLAPFASEKLLVN